MCWLAANLVIGFVMKEVGKKSLQSNLSKSLEYLSYVLIIYQGTKLAGSFLYFLKLGYF